MRKTFFSMLFLTFAHAEISFQSIKGIHSIQTPENKTTSIFQEGFDHLSPIWGFLALKTGMIENLRFFGTYNFGWDENDSFKREYSKDKGQDGITKLVRILFPSTGGQLTTTAEHEGNLGKKMTPALIGVLLNNIQQIRANHNEPISFNIEDQNILRDIKNNTGYKESLEKYNNAEIDSKKKDANFKEAKTKLNEKISENHKKDFEQFCENIETIKKVTADLKDKWTETINGWKENKIIKEEEKEEKSEETKVEKNLEENQKETETASKKNKKAKNSNENNEDRTTSKFIYNFEKKLEAENKSKELKKSTPDFLSEGMKKGEDFNAYINYLIQDCLENEKKGFYPKHTTEHIVLAFLWSNFNTKDDIKKMYESLDENYIQKNFIQHINEDLLNSKDIESEINLEDLSAKNLEEAIQIAYGIKYMGHPTPYVSGESLISNSTTNFYDRSKITDKNDLNNRKVGEIKDQNGYADCVEVSQRHLFNFVLFDGEKFNLKNLEENLEKIKKKEPTSAFLNMKEWFYGEQQPTKDKSNAGDIVTRSAWNGVMGDLNHDCALCKELNEKQKNFYKVYYHRKIDHKNDKENRNELHPGFINRLNVIEHVLGVRLEDLGTEEEKEDIKKWTETLINEDLTGKTTEKYKEAYKNYVTTKMKIFLNSAKNENYEFNIQNFNFEIKKGLDDGHPHDLFDSDMKIKGKKGKIFNFIIKSFAGHGVTSFVSKEEEKNFTIPQHLKKTLFEAYLKQSEDVFYKLYAHNLLNDYDAKRTFLEKLMESNNFDKEKYFSLIQCILSQIGLEDRDTAKKSVDVLNGILNLYNDKNPEDILKYVSSIEIDLIKKIMLGRNFSNFNRIMDTWTEESIKFNDISEVSLGSLEKETTLPQNLKNLFLIEKSIDFSILKGGENLQDLTIKTKNINIDNMPFKKLKTLTLSIVSEQDEVVKDFILPNSLEKLNLSFKKQNQNINTLDISALKEGKNLKDLNISAKKVIIDSIPFENLETLQIDSEDIDKLNVDRDLKTLNLCITTKDRALGEFDFSNLTVKGDLEKLIVLGIPKNKINIKKLKEIKIPKAEIDLSGIGGLELIEIMTQYGTKTNLTFKKTGNLIIKDHNRGCIILNGDKLIDSNSFTLIDHGDGTCTLQDKK